MRRAQAALELLILLVGAFAVITAAMAAFDARTDAVQQRIAEHQMDAVLRILSIEVTLASQVQDGYVREFSLPLAVGGAPYALRVLPKEAPSEIVLSSVAGERVLFLPVTLEVGSSISPGGNTIERDAGSIRLSPR